MRFHKFRRVTEARKIAGVCGGIAYALGIPAWLVRAIALCALVFWGVGLVVYLILWVCVPKWDGDPSDVQQVIG